MRVFLTRAFHSRRNPRVPCNSLPAMDFSHWADRGSKCNLNNKLIEAGKTERISPCVMCVCTKEGVSDATSRPSRIALLYIPLSPSLLVTHSQSAIRCASRTASICRKASRSRKFWRTRCARCSARSRCDSCRTRTAGDKDAPDKCSASPAAKNRPTFRLKIVPRQTTNNHITEACQTRCENGHSSARQRTRLKLYR